MSLLIKFYLSIILISGQVAISDARPGADCEDIGRQYLATYQNMNLGDPYMDIYPYLTYIMYADCMLVQNPGNRDSLLPLISENMNSIKLYHSSFNELSGLPAQAQQVLSKYW